MEPKKTEKDLTLKVACQNPECGKKNRVDFAKVIGKKVQCGACKTEIHVQPVGMS